MAVPVQVTCINCDEDTVVPSDEVQITTCGRETNWTYRCPTCSAWITRQATKEHLSRFAGIGMVPKKVAAPGPPLIGKMPPKGAPISEDDLIRFGLEIEALADG